MVHRVESYSLEFKLENFIVHALFELNKTGKLIVIDGGDGSGKTTQAQLLVEYLKNHGKLVKYIDFPRYYESFHGQTVARFLRGEFGGIDEVSPYLASLPYAMDRNDASIEMKDFLSRGGYIISNRYATSNMAHQGAKFESTGARDDFLKWIYTLEYKAEMIPKEDIVIYLSVPPSITSNLIKKKDTRAYLNGEGMDIHEKNQDHQQKTREMYLYLAQLFPHWSTIECTDKTGILEKSKIHDQILDVLQSRHIL